jgi:hypothetical protein
MKGLRKVIATGELVTGLLTDHARLAQRGTIEVLDGLPEGARLVYAEVDREATIDKPDGQPSLVLIFEHPDWPDMPDGSVPTIRPTLAEVER